MIGPHLAISEATNFLCSAPSMRLSVITTAPKPCSFLMNSGSFKAACRALLSLASTSGGVPLGAYSPCQMLTSKPFKPASFKVGKSFSAGVLKRFKVVTANALTDLASIWLVVLVVWSHSKSI